MNNSTSVSLSITATILSFFNWIIAILIIIAFTYIGKTLLSLLIGILIAAVVWFIANIFILILRVKADQLNVMYEILNKLDDINNENNPSKQNIN